MNPGNIRGLEPQGRQRRISLMTRLSPRFFLAYQAISVFIFFRLWVIRFINQESGIKLLLRCEYESRF